MPRTWLFRLLLLALLFTLGWGAGSSLRASRHPGWTPNSGKLRVLTTIYPLYDFAREVGGDAVEVRNLLPPGVDPHEYAPSPSDASLVSHADLLVANGLGLDDFLAETMRKTDVASRRALYCAEGLPALHSDGSAAHGEHGHADGDPHMWLDPDLARHYVRKLSAEIIAGLEHKGKAHLAHAVAQRAGDYDRRLAELDRDYREGLAPVSSRPFFAFHSAYGYLAARYGLRTAGVWEPAPGRQPGPRDVARLIDLAHARNVDVFFAEPGFSSRAVEMIAADAQLSVIPLDPLETAVDFEGMHYLDGMRRNLETLRHALCE